MPLSGSWFHIIFGFILGISSTIFTIKIVGLLKKHSPFKKFASTLILFSLSVTLIFYIYISAISGGILVEWQFLGFPAIGDPAIKLLEIGYVETKSGNIYHSVCLDCQDKNWELVDEVSKNQEGISILSTSDCKTLSFLPLQQHDFIDSKSVCTTSLWDRTKTAYAIDDRGHVYSWIHSVYPGDQIVPWYVENQSLIVAGVASSIFGAIIMLLLAFSDFLMNKNRVGNTRTNLVE